MFKNKRYITIGINERIPLALQLIIWEMIDEMEIEQDFLQIFELSNEKENQIITHSQEQPHYCNSVVCNLKIPVKTEKIYVIDNGEYSTMLLSEEY